jgi:predicted permease
MQDVRYALRLMLASPIFTCIAIVTLAVGIAANTTVLSLVDTLFYRTIPAPEAHRFVGVNGMDRKGGWYGLSYPEYVHIRDHVRTLDTLVAQYTTAPLNVFVDGDAREAEGAIVSANYFPTVGIQPLLGRFFTADEDRVPDRDAVAVISFTFWQQRLGGTSNVLGKPLRVNGRWFTVIGVAPEGFHGIDLGASADVWIPTMMLRVGYRWCDAFTISCRPLDPVGRLAPRRTLAEAQAEVAALMAQLATVDADAERDHGARVWLARGVGQLPAVEFGAQVQLLVATAGVLLLLACANLAGLLVARGVARRKEIALRLSIGATRGRVIRQLVTESVLLALVGCVLGVLLSSWAKDLLLAFYAKNAEGYTHVSDLRIAPWVLAASALIGLAAGVLFGIAPAIQSSRLDLTSALKADAGSTGGRSGWTGTILLVGQIALSLAMVVAAALLARSASAVHNGMNLDPSHVAILRVRPRLVQYTPEHAQTFHRDVVQQLERTPGVTSVSLARGIGLVWLSTGNVRVRRPEEAAGIQVDYHEIAPRYFETLGIPMLSGREFDARDRSSSPRVVVINESLARRLWPTTALACAKTPSRAARCSARSRSCTSRSGRTTSNRRSTHACACASPAIPRRCCLSFAARSRRSIRTCRSAKTCRCRIRSPASTCP